MERTTARARPLVSDRPNVAIAVVKHVSDFYVIFHHRNMLARILHT